MWLSCVALYTLAIATSCNASSGQGRGAGNDSDLEAQLKALKLTNPTQESQIGVAENGGDLICRMPRMCMAELDVALKTMIVDKNMPIPKACKIVSCVGNPIADIKFREVAKEALRESYHHILICAQHKSFIIHKQPQDYHWLYALSWGMSWFRPELWEGIQLGWEIHYDEILKADNAQFFREALNKKLFPSFIRTSMPSLRHIVTIYDAATIMKDMAMTFSKDWYSTPVLAEHGYVNILRQLVKEGTDVFADLKAPLKIVDPDVLDFVMPKDPRAVNVQWTVGHALKNCKVDLLRVLSKHKADVSLDSMQLTNLARRGCANILQFVHSVNSNIKPTKDCLPDILIRGHVKVFNFLHSLDATFLPESYEEWEVHHDALWHHDMVVRIYEIDPIEAAFY